MNLALATIEEVGDDSILALLGLDINEESL